MPDKKLTHEEWKKARAEYGADYERHVLPHYTYFIEVQKLSQEWGRLAARTLFILNGGGLVLLPTLTNLAKTAVNPNAVGAAATWFIAGLVTAGLLTLCGYVNMLSAARETRSTMERQMSIAAAIHYQQEWPAEALRKADEGERKARYDIYITLYLGIASGLASAALFVVGATRLIG